MNYQNFGDFLCSKRLARKITLRQLAAALSCTPVFVSDVEKDRRNPFDMERLQKLTAILKLSDEDRDLMYDLAGKKRQEVAPDIQDYIKDNDYVSAALRTCRDMQVGEDEWEKMIAELKRRRG
ncbi:MAG: helix-turn-helix transcriptional regulator [Selenomonadaceae bacterium]|nr:helix-turn-helix transcriptional regulator [Selenomonadaceae bacterium]